MRRSHRALESQAHEGPSTHAIECDAGHPFALAGAFVALAWLISLLAVFVLPSPARAISFDVEFRSSTEQVLAGDSYADLLLKHASGTFLSA